MSTEIKINDASSRVAWNKGRFVGQKRPLRPKEVWAIRVRLQITRRKRDLAMFNLAIDSKLRGCDLVSLRVDDIASGGHVRDRATIVQHKTGRPVQFEITEQTRTSLQDWLNVRPTDRGPHVFPSRPQPTPSDGSPIRAHSARLDRGCRDGEHGLRHAFAAPHQGGADLPQDRQSASGPVASRNGYIGDAAKLMLQLGASRGRGLMV
jgi:integrase